MLVVVKTPSKADNPYTEYICVASSSHQYRGGTNTVLIFVFKQNNIEMI